MRYGAIIAALAASLAFAGMAAEASAQSQSRAPQVSVAEAAAARAAASQTQRRALRLNDSGRWGIDFSLSQPQGRDAQWGDVAAGAYYRVTPRFQVGASAGLSEPPVDPAVAHGLRSAAPWNLFFRTS